MDRYWLKNYPQGVPADIDASRYKSLIQLFDEAFKVTPMARKKTKISGPMASPAVYARRIRRIPRLSRNGP